MQNLLNKNTQGAYVAINNMKGLEDTSVQNNKL